MTNSEPPPPPIYQRRTARPRYESIQSPFGGGGKVFMFAVLACICGAGAAYMALVERMPVTDMRVIAPAIGAVWFGLRVVMALTPRV